MKKRLIVTTLALVLLVAVLAAVKTMQIGAMIDQGKNSIPPPKPLPPPRWAPNPGGAN